MGPCIGCPPRDVPRGNALVDIEMLELDRALETN